MRKLTKKESVVWQICDTLTQNKKPITIRSVGDALEAAQMKRGSNRDVAQYIRSWRLENDDNNHTPLITAPLLPEVISEMAQKLEDIYALLSLQHTPDVPSTLTAIDIDKYALEIAQETSAETEALLLQQNTELKSKINEKNSEIHKLHELILEQDRKLLYSNKRYQALVRFLEECRAELTGLMIS